MNKRRRWEITSHAFFSVPSIRGGAAKSYPELWALKFEDNVPLRSDVMTVDQPWVINPDEEDMEGTGHEEPAHQEEPDSSRSHREEENTVSPNSESHYTGR
ncbi:hypothetical protein LINGRAHAP2_LOCUS9988 [Linum grandiflorum]